MTKDEEYKGFWFLSENPEKRVPGILYYRVDREIRLELIGGFETKVLEFLFPKSIDIIHGITHENVKISLFICNRDGGWNMSSDYPLTNYNCQYFIRGKHLTSVEEEVFDRVQVDLTSLYEWYPSGLIKCSVNFFK